MTSPFLRPGGTPHPAYLIQGDDAGLVTQELIALIEGLSGLDETGAESIEEYGDVGRNEPFSLFPVLDACRTPPFFAQRRIVVVRDAALLDAEEVTELVSYLGEPLETTVLVLAHVGRSAPSRLIKAIRSVGLCIDAVPGSSSRARSQWFSDQLRDGPVKLDGQAVALLREHLGEDLARLEGVLAMLEAAFGKNATIHVADLEPFLGTAGGVAPWDLTDALDDGDSTQAVAALHRLLGGGERHPMQVLATLHRHYGAMLALDGADVVDEESAASLTGLAAFPAKKVLLQSRRLGHDRIVRAITQLSSADIDVRGRIGWPPELVLEVLIARLAQLSRLPTSTSMNRRRSPQDH
jgi:DNA polymerase-3 subunit delta